MLGGFSPGLLDVLRCSPWPWRSMQKKDDLPLLSPASDLTRSFRRPELATNQHPIIKPFDLSMQ